MRKIRCADCGKSYDYDVDDFCPRCGSFNPPPDSGATRLEQELLSRFQRPGSVGPSAGKSTGKTTARTVNYHPTYGSGPDLKKGKTHSARINDCGACEPRKKKSGVKGLVILVVVLAVLFIGVPLIEAVTEQIFDAVYSFTDSFGGMEEDYGGTAAEPAWENTVPALPEGWYASYDTFTLSNGQQVSVGDAWEPWLPDDFMERYPDNRCVAVALWVLGEPGDSYIPVGLMTEDGTICLPEELPPEVEEECGLDSVSLADGTANEEIFGYSFYFLPENVADQALTAVVMDEENVYVSIGVE